MTHGLWQRLRTEGRDLIELVLLPGLAALLPWPLCFQLFRLVARCPWLYRETVAKSLQEAQAMGQVLDARQWLWARRLVTLVDHADLYLAWARSDRWMNRHLDVSGAWPAPGSPALLCTFHWGAGMWALRHAARSGLTPNALVASLDPGYFVKRRVLYRYAVARTAQVAKTLGRPTIDVAKNLRGVFIALKRGEPLLAAVDAPADQADASQWVSLAGFSARVPTALLRLATDRKVALVVYTTGLDLRTGQRRLEIHHLAQEDGLESQVIHVFSFLQKKLATEPVAWHFWSEAPRIFVNPPIDTQASQGATE